MRTEILSAARILTLMCISISCFGCQAKASNPFLEKILHASSDKDFNEALLIYGTLQSEDVPDVTRAIKAFSSQRRKNAARMLSICRQTSCGQEQVNAVRGTKDIMVWAILIEVAAKTDENILREKPELLEKALNSENPELLAPALRVAIKIDRQGIQEKLLELLNSKNMKVLEVVLTNLSPAFAKQEAARLAGMLEDEKTYGDVEMEIALALVRADDPRYYPNLQAFVARLKTAGSDHMFFNEAFLSEDKQMVDLLWKIARMKDGEILAGLRDQAYDVLTRRCWAPAMHEPVTVELMEMTLGYLKQASLDTNPRAHLNDASYGAESALYLIAFVNKGNTDSESFLYGKDAIEFTETWLKEHKK